MSLKSSGKPGRPSTKETKRRRRAVARNLANGMGKVEALVKAGYARNHAETAGYRIVKHPEIQSILTEAVARVLTEENKKFDDIVRPYVKALGACVVVKSSQFLQVAETEIPDHSVRMEAAAHLAKLYQPKNVEDPAEEDGNPGHPVLYQINFIDAGAKPASPVIVSPEPSTTAAKGAPPPAPRVSFVNGKR